jgi:imidazolonepropionase
VGKQTGSILIRGARQLLTLRGTLSPRRGGELNELGIIRDGALLVCDGVIQEVGPTRRVENLAKARDAVEISAVGRVVMPGFVDSHTHLMCPPPGVAEEDVQRAARLVRTSSARRLAGRIRTHLETMARHGTTTVEAKTGCCLDEGAEIKLLRVMAALKDRPLDVVPTFLIRLPQGGPYGDAEEAVDWVCREFLARISRRRLARFVDLVLDGEPDHQHWFERLLRAAGQTGLACKIHSGARTARTAAALAAGCNVVSIDHLEDASPEEAKALAGFRGVATLLPCYGFYCPRAAACARSLIEAGIPIALASNFNPQHTPTLNMQTVVALASTQFGLTAAEAISAATINGAHAAGCASRAGSLELGKMADLLIVNISDYRELAEQFGMNLVHLTMKRGAFIYKEGEVAPLAAEDLHMAW